MAQLDLVVKVLTKGDRELETLAGRLRGVGTGLTLGVTAPIIGIGAAALQSAADAEKAQAKVEAAFESMGASSFTTVEALNEQAEAMSRATTFDDDSIKEAQATLLTFGNIGEESFERATAAALDMSSFFGTDLQAASVQLGKALNDPIAGLSALSRIGVQFTDEQKAMIEQMVAAGDVAGAQGIIFTEVERQLGTAAEAMAGTHAGKMQQAMNQLGEAGEALGVLLLPVLSTVASVVSSVATAFTSLPGPVQAAIAVFLGLAAVVGPILLVASAVVGMGAKVAGAFGVISKAFGALKLLLLTNPFVALAAAVVALVALIVLNWDKIVEVFKGALRFITDTGKKLWTPLSKGFGAAIDFIKGAWNAFARWWNGIQISVPSFDIPFVGRVGGFSIGLPDLPYLAEGGIVNRPTLAVIGEAGPEAVVPLDKYGTGGQTLIVNVNVDGDLKAEEDTLPTIITRALYVAGVTEQYEATG